MEPSVLLDDAMAIAIYQRLGAELKGQGPVCPQFFSVWEKTDGYACLRLADEVSPEIISTVLAPVMSDFKGFIQQPPGWVTNPGRLGADFAVFRGNSIAGVHAVEIGVLEEYVVILDRMFRRDVPTQEP